MNKYVELLQEAKQVFIEGTSGYMCHCIAIASGSGYYSYERQEEYVKEVLDALMHCAVFPLCPVVVAGFDRKYHSTALDWNVAYLSGPALYNLRLELFDALIKDFSECTS